MVSALWAGGLAAKDQIVAPETAKSTEGIDRRVIHTEFGWWFPEDPAPEYGVWKSNANVLTSVEPPFDPQMGTYQPRSLLCRVSKYEGEQGTV